MVIHKFRTKRAASYLAKGYRKLGYNCNLYKKKKGYSVSVTKR